MQNNKPLGIKYDSEKLKWDLLPYDVLEEVVKVFMYGIKKYERDNWKYVRDFQSRYINALQRHLSHYVQGSRTDDSGLPIMAHIISNAIFLLWAELNPEEFEKRQGSSIHTSICPKHMSQNCTPVPEFDYNSAGQFALVGAHYPEGCLMSKNNTDWDGLWPVIFNLAQRNPSLRKDD